jgi:hypothetical protein
MRLRRLQQLDEVDGWYDDAYAYENDEGRVVFRYNLTWESFAPRWPNYALVAY